MKLTFLPLTLFAVLVALLGFHIFSHKQMADNFEVRQAPVQIAPKGEYALINFFASWCISCKAEHEILLKLKADHTLALYGVAWKDTKEALEKWRAQNQNPYHDITMDMNGKTAIAYGITGVPESFLIDREGNIIYHHAGPLTEDVVKKELLPRLK